MTHQASTCTQHYSGKIAYSQLPRAYLCKGNVAVLCKKESIFMATTHIPLRGEGSPDRDVLWLQEACIAGVRQAATEEDPFGQCTVALGMLHSVLGTCQTSQLKCLSGCHSKVSKSVLFTATAPFETQHYSLCQECTNSVLCPKRSL